MIHNIAKIRISKSNALNALRKVTKDKCQMLEEDFDIHDIRGNSPEL